jgi:hypothetical protein
MSNVSTLDPKKVTFVPIETAGTKFIKYELIELNKVYVPPMSDNPVRVKGKDPKNVYKLTQIFARVGIDYSRMPPVVYKESFIKDGKHYEYVLVAGNHRFEAFEHNKFTQWIFGVYEFSCDGLSFEDSLYNFELIENDHTPQLESSEDDVVNMVSRMISHGSKLVSKDEKSIRDYIETVCSNKHHQTKGSIVRRIVRQSGAYQDIVTYTAEDAFKWLKQNTDYTFAGDYDKKRKKYGWTVVEGYEYEYVVNATKKYAETGKESYFILHTKSPTEKFPLDDKRVRMKDTFKSLEDSLVEVFKYYEENGIFPWNVEGYLPQNHKTKESSFIKV